VGFGIGIGLGIAGALGGMAGRRDAANKAMSGLGPGMSQDARDYGQTPGFGDRGAYGGGRGATTGGGGDGGGRRGLFPTSVATFRPLREYAAPESTAAVAARAVISQVPIPSPTPPEVESVSFLSDIASAFTAIAPIGNAISSISNIFSSPDAPQVRPAPAVVNFAFEGTRAGESAPFTDTYVENQDYQDFGFEDFRAQDPQQNTFFESLAQNFGDLTQSFASIFTDEPVSNLPVIQPGQGTVGASILAFPTNIAPLVGTTIAHGASTLMGFILGKATSNTGQRVSRRDIYNAAKHCGLGVAAQTYGLSESEVCQIVVKGLPRRRRGISAADLRRTRSTIRKISTMRKDLRSLAR